MPRAERALRLRADPYPTSSPVKTEKSPSPDPTSATVNHEASHTPSPSPSPTKSKPKKRSTDDTESPSKGKGYNYDRGLLVSLVAKYTRADFMALGGIVNKSASQCKDTWRKTVYPALLVGKEWSNSGPGWDTAMKLHLAREVLGTAKLEKADWEAVAQHFPDRTATQVHDIWRKVVLPRLMGGRALN